MGEFRPGQTAKKFDAGCVYWCQTGKVLGPSVQTKLGYHLIEIAKRTGP